ncbi:molybdopterin-binding/glycosyltransferase family 2 protein [Rhodoblastus sp. 17X3]|uniref:molybdopterin-binding/glycosyltransferase family 2 protein n=1 Tax=Rhodoblastus sp. 17X3 TaxID=3047026 RepID=UPI0024B7A2CA|nr:molybdopterin-binding/glycosyltransferase family 2 protein [Rhodoblastus sp. 17X3]MDI9847789.1 molybdopterin-binding/glycosyltransferase family 2 protein [Rhodoblastus sp. 17X3]
MKFVTLPARAAEGGLLAHSLTRPGLNLPKGVRLGSEEVARLRAAGVESVTVAMIDATDVLEDRAAERIARRLAGAGLRAGPAKNGRCDIVADHRGLALFAPETIHALNRIDESITLATLPPYEAVSPGQPVATIKVNPFATPEAVVAAWESFGAVFQLAGFQPHRVALIQTVAPGLKASLLEKTAAATRKRLEALGSALCADARAPHEAEALAREIRHQLHSGADLVLICGAGSTSDRGDVVPAAMVAAGGAVECFGMPVDPGNLLTLGSVGDVVVVGMPGCARSHQLNGFDYVLQRLLSRQKVAREDLAAMGVGGLLRAAPRRVFPCGMRDVPPAAPHKIAALVLAAGQSRRMGANKLVLTLEGKPVIRHVLDAIADSRIATAFVVLGHEAEQVQAALAQTDARFVVNADFDGGLSTSLKAGLAALPPDIDGAMIFLGDMPDIDPALIDRMIEAFDPGRMQAIVVPKREGRRGHPVLWGKGFFPLLLQETQGDTGARHLIGQYADWVAEIEADDDGVLVDLDTPEAFLRRQKSSAPA